MFRPRNSNVPARIRPGIVARPPHSAEQPRRLLAEPISSLYDCVSRGTIHMDRAAKLILEKKRSNTFNQTAYDEFRNSSEVATRAQRMTFDGIDSMEDPLEEMRLNAIASRLQGDIIRAQIRKVVRTLEMKEESVNPESLPKVGVENCTKSWKISPQYPFVEVNIVATVSNKWRPRSNMTTFQRLMSMYRLILTQITDPPNKIQEYAIRVNNAGGRDEKLKDLPPEIEDLLIGFAEDALGYGHEELVPGFEGDLESSSFYESLGNNEEERRRELSQMRHDRAIWRPHLYHGLQKALDVRASKYKENDNSWFPSNRQKKKSVTEVPENNIETTSDRQKRKAVAEVPENNIETTSNRQKKRALAEAPEDNIEIIDDYAYLGL